MLFMLLIGLIVILLDQGSKILVSLKFEEFDSKVVIKDFFYLTYLRNDGIAWGIDAKLYLLIIITIIALSVFVFMSIKLKIKKDSWFIITLGFLFGGTVGNFIDRLFQADHSVIDFLNFYLYYPSIKGGFHFDYYDFPVFNIADSFIVVGAIMLIIYFIFIFLSNIFC